MKNIYDWRPEIDKLPTRQRANFPDIPDEDFWRLYDIGKQYSMIHVTGFFNIYSSIRYVCENGIEGDFVECGVWLGGASIFAALAFRHFGATQRKVHLYDTFAGFPENSYDVRAGEKVRGPRYKNFRKAVEGNIRDSGISEKDYTIVEGPVEQTLAQALPTQISILRLDTDHYSSTRIEMEQLFPRLSQQGILIVDDYGMYEGSRRAVDEYLSSINCKLLLTRIDKGIRSAIVTGS